MPVAVGYDLEHHPVGWKWDGPGVVTRCVDEDFSVVALFAVVGDQLKGAISSMGDVELEGRIGNLKASRFCGASQCKEHIVTDTICGECFAFVGRGYDRQLAFSIEEHLDLVGA